MFSAEVIRDMQTTAAREAARKHRVPYVVWPQDQLDRFPFPFLGTYVPKGWRHLTHAEGGVSQSDHGIYGNDHLLLFCDNSGWGADDEPALSRSQAIATIKAISAHAYKEHGLTVGWAIEEAGQFQVNLAAYAKPEEGSTP